MTLYYNKGGESMIILAAHPVKSNDTRVLGNTEECVSQLTYMQRAYVKFFI